MSDRGFNEEIGMRPKRPRTADSPARDPLGPDILDRTTTEALATRRRTGALRSPRRSDPPAERCVRHDGEPRSRPARLSGSGRPIPRLTGEV